MKCPVCREPDLVMSDRQGIEIDYCPQCRGVWLDRGELDKIIERSASLDSGARRTDTPERDSFRHQSEYRKEPRYKDDDDYDRYGKHRHKKHGGFLGELFDF